MSTKFLKRLVVRGILLRVIAVSMFTAEVVAVRYWDYSASSNHVMKMYKATPELK